MALFHPQFSCKDTCTFLVFYYLCIKSSVQKTLPHVRYCEISRKEYFIYLFFATPVAVGEEGILLSFLAELTDPQYVCGNHNSSRKFPWMLRKGASLLPFSMGSAGLPFFWKEEEEIPSHDSNVTHLNHSWKQTVNVTGKRCRSCKCKLMGHGNKMGKHTWYFEPSPAGF